MDDPQKLIDSVIRDMERRTTEARLQALAAELARRRAVPEADVSGIESAQEALARLENALRDLRARRDALVARVRDADARLAIERSLMEADGEPGYLALELLSQQAIDSEAQADATAEIRGRRDG